MKEKIMARLPFIFAYYTIISVISCIYNLALGCINFKSNLLFLLAEISVAYVLFLIFGYFFHWIAFTPGKLFGATLLFFINVVLGVAYMNYRYKLRAKELKELIKKRR